VDSIGPWRVTVNGHELLFKALRTICTASNLCEIVRTREDTSVEAGRLFETSWLHRYPRPLRCIHDNGREFKYGFLRVLQQWGIQNVTTTKYNPQSNAICERMHSTVGDILRTYCQANPPQSQQQAAEMVDRALSVATHALRVAVHRTLRVSPGAIVFHRDMLLNIPLIADLVALRDKRQAVIDYNLQRANAKRIDYNYQVGDFVSDLTINPAKMDPRAPNRFQIVEMFPNGTVTILRRPGVTERINIRRIKPVS
jgi:transposase InsO family protein